MTVAEKPIRLPRRLDVGAGSQEHIDNSWVTLDIVSVFRPDVLGTAYHLPFQDESLKAVRCHHVLEHIPRDYFVFHEAWTRQKDGMRFPAHIEQRKGLVDVMNEMWRVLEIGGQAWVEVPVFPSEEAIADPTHGSFFVSGTFDYFTRCPNHSTELGHLFVCREDQRRLYGIKPWEITRREKVNHARILVLFMTKLADEEVVPTPITAAKRYDPYQDGPE